MPRFEPERLLILEQSLVGWKSPVPVVRFLLDMNERRFRQLFNPEKPRVQISDQDGNMIKLTPELTSLLNQVRLGIEHQIVSRSRLADQIAVYLCYSHLDTESLAQPLIQTIESSPALALRSVEGNLDSSIQLREYPRKVIDHSDLVLFLLTNNSLNSYWALYEILCAAEAQQQKPSKKTAVIDLDSLQANFRNDARLTYLQRTIYQNMATWESRIAANLREVQGEDLVTLSDHQYAITQVKDHSYVLAQQLVNWSHPPYSFRGSINDSQNVELWIQKVVG